MSDCIIVVDHAEKRFGEQVALRDVSVSFEAGKIHGIIGRNGSGKTVLFKCIVGLMPLTSGSIQVNGRHIETGQMILAQLLKRLDFSPTTPVFAT